MFGLGLSFLLVYEGIGAKVHPLRLSILTLYNPVCSLSCLRDSLLETRPKRVILVQGQMCNSPHSTGFRL